MLYSALIFINLLAFSNIDAAALSCYQRKDGVVHLLAYDPENDPLYDHTLYSLSTYRSYCDYIAAQQNHSGVKMMRVGPDVFEIPGHDLYLLKKVEAEKDPHRAKLIQYIYKDRPSIFLPILKFRNDKGEEGFYVVYPDTKFPRPDAEYLSLEAYLFEIQGEITPQIRSQLRYIERAANSHTGRKELPLGKRYATFVHTKTGTVVVDPFQIVPTNLPSIIKNFYEPIVIKGIEYDIEKVLHSNLFPPYLQDEAQSLALVIRSRKTGKRFVYKYLSDAQDPHNRILHEHEEGALKEEAKRLKTPDKFLARIDGFDYSVIAYEYEPGPTLKEFRDSLPNNTDEFTQKQKDFVTTVLIKTYQAVKERHKNGIILSDLKPFHFVINTDPIHGVVVKIVDRGGAFTTDEKDPYQLRTPYYAAPEVKRDATLPSTFESDLYAVGRSFVDVFNCLDGGKNDNRKILQIFGRAGFDLINALTLDDPQDRNKLLGFWEEKYAGKFQLDTSAPTVRQKLLANGGDTLTGVNLVQSTNFGRNTFVIWKGGTWDAGTDQPDLLFKPVSDENAEKLREDKPAGFLPIVKITVPGRETGNTAYYVALPNCEHQKFKDKYTSLADYLFKRRKRLTDEQRKVILDLYAQAKKYRTYEIREGYAPETYIDLETNEPVIDPYHIERSVSDLELLEKPSDLSMLYPVKVGEVLYLPIRVLSPFARNLVLLAKSTEVGLKDADRFVVIKHSSSAFYKNLPGSNGDTSNYHARFFNKEKSIFERRARKKSRLRFYSSNARRSTMVIDWIAGSNLNEYFVKEKFPNKMEDFTDEQWKTFETIVDSIFSNMVEHHQDGILIVDIKPDNTIVTPKLSVEQIDYEGSTINDGSKQFPMATPRYKAPEIRGKFYFTASQETDYWSTGVMIAEKLGIVEITYDPKAADDVEKNGFFDLIKDDNERWNLLKLKSKKIYDKVRALTQRDAQERGSQVSRLLPKPKTQQSRARVGMR